MNKDQMLSLLSTLLKVAGMFVLAHATYMTSGMWEQISGALIMVAPVIWDMFNHTAKSTLQSAAAVVGDDGKPTIIVTSPELAKATPETNIVSNATTQVSAK